MKQGKSRDIAGLGLMAVPLMMPGCVSYEDYGNGGYYSGGYYGDPYWGYGPWYIHDDDDDHHNGDGDSNRPARPTHPIAPPDRGQRPAQLPSRSIPAAAPRPSMGGGGRGGGRGGGGRR
jgi:hypothetical protein